MIRRFALNAHTFMRDRSGVALIEFAMVFPILMTMYLGGFQLMDAVSAYRKVSTVTRSIADLTTQNASVTDGNLNTYLEASAQVMAPYATSRGTFRVSMINVSNTGVATVAWSKSKNGTRLATGSAYTLPTGVGQPNVGVVVCDVVYNYHPLAFFGLLGDIPFTDQIFMIPRKAPNIALVQ